VERARTLYGIQREQLYPAVNATAGASKQRTAADLTQAGQSRISERYDAAVGVYSWEIDFFGRVRSLKGRALEEYLATEQARRGAQALLVSAVANAYLNLAADREGLALAQSTLETPSRPRYDLVRRSTPPASPPNSICARRRSRWKRPAVIVARYTQRVAQDENALNLLAGRTPSRRTGMPATLDASAPPAQSRGPALRRAPAAARCAPEPRICSKRPTPTSAPRARPSSPHLADLDRSAPPATN
jgi:multidrug efflux system outer membrane protein